jgi:hypothetical protein
VGDESFDHQKTLLSFVRQKPYRGFDAAERNQKSHWNLLDLFGSFCIKAKTNKEVLQATNRTNQSESSVRERRRISTTNYTN